MKSRAGCPRRGPPTDCISEPLSQFGVGAHNASTPLGEFSWIPRRHAAPPRSSRSRGCSGVSWGGLSADARFPASRRRLRLHPNQLPQFSDFLKKTLPQRTLRSQLIDDQSFRAINRAGILIPFLDDSLVATLDFRFGKQYVALATFEHTRRLAETPCHTPDTVTNRSTTLLLILLPHAIRAIAISMTRFGWRETKTQLTRRARLHKQGALADARTTRELVLRVHELGPRRQPKGLSAFNRPLDGGWMLGAWEVPWNRRLGNSPGIWAR